MTYALTFIAGAFVGGFIVLMTMCMMIQAGQADDREEAWFDDERGIN